MACLTDVFTMYTLLFSKLFKTALFHVPTVACDTFNPTLTASEIIKGRLSKYIQTQESRKVTERK